MKTVKFILLFIGLSLGAAFVFLWATLAMPAIRGIGSDHDVAGLIVMTVFLGGGSSALLTGFIMMTLTSIKQARILKTGLQALGKVEKYHSNLTVNGVSVYKIEFSYTDERGQTCYQKTRSKYTLAQCQYLKSLSQIEVRHRDGTAVIAQFIPVR